MLPKAQIPSLMLSSALPHCYFTLSCYTHEKVPAKLQQLVGKTETEGKKFKPSVVLPKSYSKTVVAFHFLSKIIK